MSDDESKAKQLRERSGASMSECRRLVVQCDGDLERAMKALRKQGLLKEKPKPP